MKMKSNKAFHPYGAQGAPRVNADVRRDDNDSDVYEYYKVDGIDLRLVDPIFANRYDSRLPAGYLGPKI